MLGLDKLIAPLPNWVQSLIVLLTVATVDYTVTQHVSWAGFIVAVVAAALSWLTSRSKEIASFEEGAEYGRETSLQEATENNGY